MKKKACQELQGMSEWTKDQGNEHTIPAELTHVDFQVRGGVQSNLECCTKLAVEYFNDNKKQIEELKIAPKYFKDK